MSRDAARGLVGVVSRDAARGLVRETGGDELLERLDHLDRVRAAARPSEEGTPDTPDAGTETDFDVVIAGGGLFSVLAPTLAARGLRVAVLERGRAGVAHREWNASGPELRPLVESGLVAEDELERLVIARYRTGTCSFHGGGSYPVDGVLDHAVDAGALLSLARARSEQRGVTFLDGHALVSQRSGPDAIALRVRTRDGDREIVARLLVDARGASSPYATADLVCPTVGGVMTGLASGSGPGEMDPEVGEILATVDPIHEGRQHVWEAFPGRPGETTVYVFYYARAEEPTSLVKLYARFFETLPTYKRGDARLVRPTFGLIPGWSRLTPAPAPPPGRVVLVGDAAARHSPLTYCGFGATLRSIVPATDLIARAAFEPGLVPPHAMQDAPVHALTGALAHMLASRAFHGDEMNGLLDASFATLHAMGQGPYAELLRDELAPEALVTFLERTARRHPAVWGQVVRGLGLTRAGRWGWSVARSMVGGRAAA
ncbi:MAG: lycopene cyclase [Polyangiaceae bacterium]